MPGHCRLLFAVPWHCRDASHPSASFHHGTRSSDPPAQDECVFQTTRRRPPPEWSATEPVPAAQSKAIAVGAKTRRKLHRRGRAEKTLRCTQKTRRITGGCAKIKSNYSGISLGR